MPRVLRTTLVNVACEGDPAHTIGVPLESIFPEPDGADFEELHRCMDTLAHRPVWTCGGGGADLFYVTLTSNAHAQQDWLALLDFQHKCTAACEALDAVMTHSQYTAEVNRFRRYDVTRVRHYLLEASGWKSF